MIEAQRSPNGWSCLPTAFAMVLEVPVRDMIEFVKHDGSEVLWPEMPEPHRRRGFHIQEMIMVAHHLGFSVTPFEGRPVLFSPLDPTKQVELDGGATVLEMMADCRGVLTGQTQGGMGHALAWDGTEAIDPSSLCRGPVRESFQPQTFWRVARSG